MVMNTTDFLRDHVAKNVWCAPDQDINLIIAPKRITGYSGALASENILWDTVYMPDKTNWYHVYQIGNMDPSKLGLSSNFNVWMSASAHCNANLVLITAYTERGREFHLNNVYFLRTIDGNILVAIKTAPEVDILPESKVYIRFYKNTYFNKPLCVNNRVGLVVRTGRVNTILDLNKMIAENLPYRTLDGAIYYTVNGKRVNDINANTVDWGSDVQWIWDSSVKEIVEMPIHKLPKFVSKRDKLDKYLLFRKGDIGNTIDYYDDNDIIIKRKTSKVLEEGLYYHRNNAKAVRMVTHKDYSIPPEYVTHITNANKWNNLSELYVQLIVRHSGLRRPLVMEHHRLNELFKLNNSDRLNAMVGTEATIDVWKAAELENSAYIDLMGVKNIYGIENESVYDAYGYNAMAMLLVGELTKFNEKDDWVNLKPGLYNVCTGFEYDRNGKLIRWDSQSKARQYPRRDKESKYVEFYPGIGQLEQDITINQPVQKLDPTLNYGFYIAPTWNNNIVGDWSYAIEGEHYELNNGEVVWKVDTVNNTTAVKSDKYFLVDTRKVVSRDYVFSFNVNMSRPLNNGDVMVEAAEIPFGQIDIWMNGYHLVQNVDYFIEWPRVTIANKEHLNQTEIQNIVIRGTGLCKPDMTLESPSDTGFVEHGRLSYNRKFDVRDDKPIRIVVNGKVRTRDEVYWSEDEQCFCMDDVPNGAPYQIFDTIVPLRLDEPIHDQFVYRSKSRKVDEQLSIYLTSKLPEQREPNPNQIKHKYALYSPMMSKILSDIKNNVIPQSSINKQLSDNQVYQIIEPYLNMRSTDPVFQSYLDLEYLNIHIHPFKEVLTLSVWEWRFIRSVNRTVFDSKLNMSSALDIEPGYEYEKEIS